MLKLQNIIFPSTSNCTEELLFFRRYGDIKYSYADTYILMDEDSMISSDTYFNGFSASKWFKYTNINSVSISLKLKGSFRVSLLYKERTMNGILERCVGEFFFNSNSATKDVVYHFDTEYKQGMYCFNILSQKDGSEFYGGYYYANIEPDMISDIHMAIVVCTYKREKYIYKNTEMLKKAFLDNEESELYNLLDVVISDNSHTLDLSRLNNIKIHIYENKNTGGAGGFTRGLIECMNISNAQHKITHVLLMDDDVVIQPESIYRTYRLLTLLKPNYQDSYIGGAMLRADRQWFQTESGGNWNAGNLISNKSGLDLRNVEDCLYNEIEEKCEFNAWFYCTIPMQFVREDNLPLPIFIRGDDVEYGLRNMTRLILMNGICVWHEPFEYKYSSSLFYYIFRNRLIDNAVCGLDYTCEQVLTDFREQFIKEVFTLRYKNAWLLLEGVNDFLKGIDWLKEQDGEQLNKLIIEKGYKLQYVDELSLPFSYMQYEKTLHFSETPRQQIKRKLLLNGLFQKPTHMAIVPVINPHIAYLYRASAALNYDYMSKKGFETYFSKEEEIRLFKAYRKLRKNIKNNYERRKKEYFERKKEIMCLEFWNKYLN